LKKEFSFKIKELYQKEYEKILFWSVNWFFESTVLIDLMF